MVVPVVSGLTLCASRVIIYIKSYAFGEGYFSYTSEHLPGERDLRKGDGSASEVLVISKRF